ncbi:hypothetical protein RHSIM_RhsimUnG0200600 [Rhododendron simsii]|uniref:DUF4283 domain-containing protein n=1 Tax=Rhododendron simsii TaxID=118357 RepID=A0A834FU80_RHOSS|nr:hypothetical protein RHSIM_RhsimUnG0200600 [Rhododendron simsii]
MYAQVPKMTLSPISISISIPWPTRNSEANYRKRTKNHVYDPKMESSGLVENDLPNNKNMPNLPFSTESISPPPQRVVTFNKCQYWGGEKVGRKDLTRVVVPDKNSGGLWAISQAATRYGETGEALAITEPSARLAAEEVNGKWVWDQKLMVKMARFLTNRDYEQDGTQNSFDFEQGWNRGVIQSIHSNPKRKEYDRNYVQGRIQKSFGSELEWNRGVFQPNSKRQETVRKANQIQKIQVQKNPIWGLDNNRRNGRNMSKGVSHNEVWRRKEQPKETRQREESRGKEMWRRKEQTESSKQGGGKGKDQQPTTTNIHLQPVGNGWLYRSAVGRLRRLYSVEEMEEIFRKEKISNVQIKAMGGRFLILTFPSKEIRDEMIQQQWLLGWFDEVNPWNGEQAKRERFAWLACYGMPLNVWNVPSFRAIGSKWGHFIEVDDNTLREKSYEKGRLLIATDNFRKIEGTIQLTVERKVYEIIVEEEESFRVVRSSKDFSSSGSEADGEDDDMADSDKDANKDADWAEGDKKANTSPIIQSDKDKTNKECVKNDMEGSATNNESIKAIDQEHASNKATVVRQSMADTTINVVEEGKHRSLEPKSANSTSPNGADDGFNEVNSNSTHGLDSMVLESQSPSKGESQKFGVPKNQDQSVEVQEVEKTELVGHKQVLSRNNVTINSPIVIDSNCSFRPSQLKSINLLVELNPSTIRKTTRSQQYEECMSKEDSMHGSSSDDMTDEDQNREGEVDTFEDTITAGEILGIDFEESDVWAIKKTFEAEGKETKVLNNNRFAPLLRSNTTI